ncbi:hypothetical protein IFM89_016453 [Coptis chinensis]|uniref:Peptidase C1A papain C-terminal domain-containing protein n=1 Tax=Coptis chinensis TaxID=261450 RepID=A0A835I2Q5_9MAGN|nr:hypothetical protein IFM89_016453 [Coptis chinensis]
MWNSSINTSNENGDLSYLVSVNEFADLTNEEFIASRNGLEKASKARSLSSFKYENVTALPSAMDWRMKGTITPIKNQGKCANYPYQGVDATCNKKEAASSAAQINGYEDVLANDENALLQAMAKKPILVSIDTSGYAFQFYSSGVFTGDCGTDLDHGVTAVAFGATSDKTKYWLVKKSWGTML